MSSPTRGEARILPHIPIEILRKISDHLDLKTAFNLTLTCRALRDAGESRVWSAIDLFKGLPLDIEFPRNQPSSADLQPVFKRLQSTLAALMSYPTRAEYVTTLLLPSFRSCKPTRAQTKSIHGLIDLVKPHLTTLAILTDTGKQVIPSAELKHLVDTYESWPKLRSFRVCTENYVDLPLIARFLGKCPRIVNFELTWTHLRQPLPPSQTEVLPADTIPNMPTLTHFATTNFTDRVVIPRLFAKMPNLTDLTLHGHWEEEYIYGTEDEGFFKTLKDLDKLEKIHWLTTDLTFEFPTRITDFPNLKAYSEVLEAGEAEADELDLLSAENLVTNPNVQHVYQLRAMRPLLEEYKSLGMTTIPPAERYAHRIPAGFNHALFHASSVVDIQYMSDEPADIRPSIFRSPPTVAPSSLHGDEVVLGMVDPCRPSNEWEEAGIRGLIVRTYSSSLTGHVLTHCRVLSRARERRFEYYIGTNRQWHEYSRYRGRRVPYTTVLLPMYIEAGVSPDWTIGVRDMELPRKVWEILEEWFDTTDPELQDDDTTEPPPGMDHDANDDDDDDDNDDDYDDDDDDDGFNPDDEPEIHDMGDGSWYTDED